MLCPLFKLHLYYFKLLLTIPCSFIISFHFRIYHIKEANKFTFEKKYKNIRNVLLTGATGYLGCNILYHLLLKTEYKIYMPVRANSEDVAYSKVENKFKYYFNIDLSNYKNKIGIFVADLELIDLGLNEKKYQELISNVDSIIHCAALVKHYGYYERFYKANVQATINILELSKKTFNKDFHYISTVGILTQSYVPDSTFLIYNENDDINNLHVDEDNLYVKTKLEAEKIVSKYREFNLNSNIYRVGNLVNHSENYCSQENINENWFFAKLKTMFDLNMLPKEISKVEMTPVDLAALAIVNIFDQQELSNKIFHIFNPNICDLSKLMAKDNNLDIKIVSIKEYIDNLLQKLEVSNDTSQIELFMLHQLWLKDNDHYKTNVQILQNLTENILFRFDFKWPVITKEYLLSGIIKKVIAEQVKVSKASAKFKELENIASTVPVPFWWVDKNMVFLGGNDITFKVMGGTKEDILGKHPYEYYPPDIADKLIENTMQVINGKHVIEFEEEISDVTTGKSRWFSATRSPLYDEDGVAIGMVGTAVEITERNEKEKLLLENQAHIVRAEEDAKFRKIVEQVVHDIRSPIATLQMILPICEVNPEHARVTLHQSAIKIQYIADQLLTRFKLKHEEDPNIEPKKAPSLISADILEIIAEKRFEYSQLSLDFIAKISQSGHFAFINVDVLAFRRMMSNLINNAVDALSENSELGAITVHLTADNGEVKIIVQDDGCGMPEEVKNKILSNIAVTEGKEDGHGIGFGQIRDTLKDNEGHLAIESEVGSGTQIILTFPQVETPDWICNSITLNSDDFIIILDDDPSIHGAWDARFEKAAPGIKCKHFERGDEAVEFINNLSEEERSHLFILTDYELLRQGIDGLDVVEKTQISRSVLVTSHHNNEKVRNKARVSSTRILPKPLAAEIPIIINNSDKKTREQNVKAEGSANEFTEGTKKVDLVFIDDDKFLVTNFMTYLLKGKKVDVYHSGTEFLKSAKDYDLDTKFLIDLQFKGEEIDGIEIAKRLYAVGFKNLYLFSGMDLDPGTAPEYLKVIGKTDMNGVANLVSDAE